MSNNQPKELKHFKVCRYAVVMVESVVIPAHNWSEAVRAFEAGRETNQTFERRLSSMAKDELVHRHSFEGDLDGAIVNEVLPDGSYLDQVADLEEEDVSVVSGKRTY